MPDPKLHDPKLHILLVTVFTIGVGVISLLTTDFLIAVTVLLLSGCAQDQPSQGMHIVLASQNRVFLAEWFGQNLGDAKLITDFRDKALYITTMGSADNIIGVLAYHLGKNLTTIYFVEPSSGQFRPVYELEEHLPPVLALVPGKQAITFLRITSEKARQELSLSDPARGYKDVMFYDLPTHVIRPLVRGRGYASLSWKPDRSQLTYDTWDGWIESVNLATQKVDQLLNGAFPAWAPDGTRLAYRTDEESVALFDSISKRSEQIHNRKEGLRYFWKRRIVGPMFWSPNGRYLSFEVERWSLLRGSQLDCVVLEVSSKKEFSVDNGGLPCGPWVVSPRLPDNEKKE